MTMVIGPPGACSLFLRAKLGISESTLLTADASAIGVYSATPRCSAARVWTYVAPEYLAATGASSAEPASASLSDTTSSTGMVIITEPALSRVAAPADGDVCRVSSMVGSGGPNISV
eukprot:CAMPEP_0182950026 /NCGR_PEP_ID=MMETSP0105_2-20130417/60557_1 /TAXON_ID=81532 ORGANISM="Acanthoeca-like sp., Strain 10tr" /NCGR_SAMPLE_ID=MMETSP0105_2 /ASSEMBLY_ACC=CAM_ASM_000205 /LENGTH=116 /DNA_ID=CAMNT_0025090327 /DNA_START=153 /DNA_END=503 /DNA_ORIENTATION=+